jgi:hypothetical protein
MTSESESPTVFIKTDKPKRVKVNKQMLVEDTNKPNLPDLKYNPNEVILADDGELPASEYEYENPNHKDYTLTDEQLADRDNFNRNRKQKFLATAAQMKGLWFLINVGKDPATGKQQWIKRFHYYRDLTTKQHEEYEQLRAKWRDLENITTPMLSLMQNARMAQERAKILRDKQNELSSKEDKEEREKLQQEIDRLNEKIANEIALDPDVININAQYLVHKKAATKKGLELYFGFTRYEDSKYTEVRDYLEAAEYREQITPPF